MIDLIGCADCSNTQDVSSLAKDLYSNQQNNNLVYFNNQKQFQQQAGSTTPTVSGTSTTVQQPVNFQTKLNYFNHNNHHFQQPVESAPHLFQLASSSLSDPTFLSSSGGALPNGSQQFTLTPDARACVTATYLCVLIVNNTWLDCNLLEMLCNNSSNSGSNYNNAATSREGQEDYSQAHSDSSSQLQVRALESALNELIAFAGGGDDGGGGGGGTDNGDDEDEQAGDDTIRSKIDGTRVAASDNIHQFQMDPGKRQVELLDRGGGTGNREDGGGGGRRVADLQSNKAYGKDNKDLLSQLLHYSQTPGRDDLVQFSRLSVPKQEATEHQQRPQAMEFAKMGRLAEEDRYRLLEHYFSLRKSHKVKKPASLTYRQPLVDDLMHNNIINNVSFKIAEQLLDQQSLPTGTTQQPTFTNTISSTVPGSSSLVNWVGRPFRGWSSYSFWSSASDPPTTTSTSSNSGTTAAISGTASGKSDLEFLQQEPKQQVMQILRPIDRTEQYNDIATNQSLLKPKPLYVSQQRPVYQQTLEQQQQQDKSNLQASESSGILTTHNGIVMGASSNKQSPVALFAIGASQTPSVVSSAGSSYSDLLEKSGSSQMRSSTTPTSLMGAIEFANNPGLVVSNGQRIQSQLDRDRELHHQHRNQLIHHQQQQQQQQQQQFLDEQNSGVECKCNELLLEDQLIAGGQSLTSLPPTSECRFRCSPLGSSSTTQTSLLDLNQLATTGGFSLAGGSSTTSPTTASSQSVLGASGISTAANSASSPVGPTSGKMNPLDVTFLLYTRHNRDIISNGGEQLVSSLGAQQTSQLMSSGELIDLTNETTLNESHLNSSLPIKVVIHGFGSGGRRPWVTDMVYKLIDYEDVNVIVVDWEKGAALPNYVQAAGNTRLVGHKIACLINSINAKYGLTGNSYHLIGFSLGAHVAGFAGMEIRNSTSISRSWINRITGLDPASPLFEGYEANDRLDPSDAQFVDVIHSNGDGVLRGGFGSLQPMGHVDFYPNGGRVQVGCNSVLLSALSDIIYGKWQSLCNHRRALNFFMDSFEFSKCRFRSFNCDSYENYLKGECFDCGLNNEKCSYMGYLANYSKGRGKMYLTTHEEAPFCANQFIIKIVGTKGYKTHWGKVEVTLVTMDGKNESFWLSSINQQSNGHDLSGGQKENTQHSMQSLIVAQPTLVNFTQLLLRYTKYKGWIYSGDESWSIDKVFITDSDGQVKSFCGFNTVLESHITTRLSLEPGNCTVVESSTGSFGVQQSTNGNEGNSRAGATSSSGGGSGAQQQMSRVSALGSSSVTSSSSTAGNPQQQQPQQQSPRTLRLFTSIMQPQNIETQAAQIMTHGHAYQRMAPSNVDRQQQQITISNNFNNIPFVAF